MPEGGRSDPDTPLLDPHASVGGDAEGLDSVEAAARLASFGPNEPADGARQSPILALLLLFLNPLVIILLLAALVSGLLGQIVDAMIVTSMVLMGVAMNFAQTYQSERAIQDLRNRVAPTATALRDGDWREILRREVVPGDLVRLCAGDLVPADGWLVTARDLFVQEANLTGESYPAEKEAIGSHPGGEPARGRVYLGTSVVSGVGIARVTETGPRTAFGAIAARLSLRPEETAFDRGLRHFGALIMRVVFFLVLFLITVSIGLHRDPLASLLFAVALAVGLTPEFLPMITSVTLAKGAVAMARKHVIVKHLSAIQNLGSVDVLCSDKTGTLTTGDMVLAGVMDPFGRDSPRALDLARINSSLETGIRSPLDTAILRAAPDGAGSHTKLDEIPFDFERRRLSVVVSNDAGRMLITKGSPEGILALSAFHEETGQVTPLDAATKDKCRSTYESRSADGFRVLAVAYRRLLEQASYSAADERDLTLAGFLVFADPVREDVASVVSSLARDGVALKIVTGDNELVARRICSSVGIEPGTILLGQDIERMDDPSLAHLAESTTLFARVGPAQKSRIIGALKRRSHVVAFMGDGINDAPSLHAADVGISVSTAADVARDAADIILLEPGLEVLHTGIDEGRKAFGNVMKYLLMGTSSNFGNMLSMAGAAFFLPFLPMLPTQILLNNFLYDLAQVTIPTDNVDEEYLTAPQAWDIGLIRKFMLLVGPISSIYDFLTFYVLIRLFHAGETEFHTGWFVESLATQTLVLFVIRTSRSPLESRPSAALAATTLAVVALGIAIPWTPVAGLLGFTPLPTAFFLFLTLASVTYLVLVEVGKRRLVRRRPSGPAPRAAGRESGA
jgi:Mg2+-importing ATPase